MIFIQWPLMLGALIPIIIVEVLIIRRFVPLTSREAFAGVAKANFLSTAIGVPVAWFLMLGLEAAVLLPVALTADRLQWKLDSPILKVLVVLCSSAWLPPSNLHTMIPAAAAVLLIPCFYLSVRIECRSCADSWASLDPAMVRRGVYLSNLVSYAVLFVLACAWIVFG